MRQRVDGIIVDAAHRLSRDHGIDDRLFSRLSGRFEERRHAVIGEHRQLYQALAFSCCGVCRRESNEDIPRTVRAEAAYTCNTHWHTPRQLSELVSQKQCIGGNYNNNYSDSQPAIDSMDFRHEISIFTPHWNNSNGQVFPIAVICLHQYPDCAINSPNKQIARVGTNQLDIQLSKL